MDHTKQMSSATPGFITFLIDQSYSMTDNFGDSQSKADFAATALNRAINEIINANAAGERVKDRCFIAIIGYGKNVKEVKTGYLDELSNSPLRINKTKRKIPDGAGGLAEIDYELPIWVESEAQGGTPMAQAFKIAKDLISGWLTQNPEYPAPIIVNISDGMPNNPNEATTAAQEIMSLQNSDGSVLLFNVHISASGKNNSLIFPNSRGNLYR